MIKKKVIFFVNAYAGGAEKMTLTIASYLDKDKYDVVFYVIGKDFGLIKGFIPDNNRSELIKITSYKDGLIFKLIAAIRKEAPQFVFSSLMPINWRLCLASSIFPKLKTILRVNNYLFTQSFIQKARLFISYRFADRLVVQTNEMRGEHVKILKLNEQKVITLANPVNIDVIKKKLQNSQSPFSVTEINYVFVGRIDVVKGIDLLIQSFSQLIKKQPNSRLYVIGETAGIFREYYNELTAQIFKLDLTDKIIFIGFTDNPYIYMKFADCFVLPSRNEGLPNVVIESLFLGTPVAVTASVPVIRRIVRDGIDGFIVDVDDAEGLADAMVKSVNLGRVSSSYKSATREDFEKLFLNI